MFLTWAAWFTSPNKNLVEQGMEEVVPAAVFDVLGLGWVLTSLLYS